MKKVILTLTVLFICQLTNAQANNQVLDTATHKIVFAQILGTSRFLSKKVTITIDFGEKMKFIEDTRIRDENGKVIVFNSMIDAMNFMGNRGWNFLQAYVITIGNQNVYHYLLNKTIRKEEVIDFNTRKDFK